MTPIDAKEWHAGIAAMTLDAYRNAFDPAHPLTLAEWLQKRSGYSLAQYPMQYWLNVAQAITDADSVPA